VNRYRRQQHRQYAITDEAAAHVKHLVLGERSKEAAFIFMKERDLIPVLDCVSNPRARAASQAMGLEDA
jgi:hypothetical protein